MGLFDKIKNTFSGSSDPVKDSTNDIAESVTDKVSDLAEEAVEVEKEKKDGCCGGNCGG